MSRPSYGIYTIRQPRGVFLRYRPCLPEDQGRYLSEASTLFQQGSLPKAASQVLRNTRGRLKRRRATCQRHESPYVARTGNGNDWPGQIPSP